MPRRALIAVAAVLLLGASAPSAGGGTKQRCPAGRVVDADRGGRVVKSGRGDATYWACLSGRRRYLLDTDSSQTTVSRVRLASPYVAYGLGVFTTVGSGYEVVLTDVARKTSRDAPVDGSLGALVVSRRGAVVFLGMGADGRPPRLQRLDFYGVTELDSGAIDPASLAVNQSGRVVYWTRDGVARSAAL